MSTMHRLADAGGLKTAKRAGCLAILSLILQCFSIPSHAQILGLTVQITAPTANTIVETPGPTATLTVRGTVSTSMPANLIIITLSVGTNSSTSSRIVLGQGGDFSATLQLCPKSHQTLRVITRATGNLGVLPVSEIDFQQIPFEVKRLPSPARDFLIFRVRGEEHRVTNPMLTELNKAWEVERCAIEAEWEDEVDSQRISAGTPPFSFTVGAENTVVTLPTALPTLTIGQGTTAGTLDFSSSFRVNWSTHTCGPFGGFFRCDVIDVQLSFSTLVTITGSLVLDRDSDGRFYLQVTNISGAARGDFVFGALLAPILSAKIQEKLEADADGDGVADIEQRLYIDEFLPDQDIIFPVYEYLAAGGQFPFELKTENGAVVVAARLGDPIIGPWMEHRTEHPRLLYDASQRLTIANRINADFQGWYDQIKDTANEKAVFPIPNADGIVSESDWVAKSVPNARIAVSAALVYDLELDKAYRNRALHVLFNFRDRINEPLFSPQWAQNSLYAAETLTTLAQAYDLLLGRDFPNDITQGDIVNNRIGLDFARAFAYRLRFAFCDLPFRDRCSLVLAGVQKEIKSRIDGKFRRLRDVIHLQTHVWDLVGSPNHALRNAGALGTSALLFNGESDAYENISLASTVIWKRLGVASGRPFDDTRLFTKASEGLGFAEGPHYLFYASELYLPFLLSYSRFIAAEEPVQPFVYNDWAERYELRLPDLLTSERVRNAHEWSLRLAMPGGDRPPIKDTDQGSFFYSGLLANSTATPDVDKQREWAWDFASSGYQTGARLVDSFVAFDTALVGGETDPSQRLPSPTQLLAASGNIVFRSDWGNSATYMHLLADDIWQVDGIVGGMRIPHHQQADNTSFLIHAHGELLALDAGYGGFPLRDFVANAQNHNLVLVDGEGPAPGTGAAVQGALDSKYLDYVEIASQYQGTDVNRHVLFVDNDYFLMVDALRSEMARAYDWQLHGAGTLTTSGARMIWETEKGNRLVSLLSTTAGGVDEVAVDAQSPHFSATRELQTHSAARARETARDVAFLAFLRPTAAGVPNPTVSTFESPSGVYAGLIVDQTRRDVLIARHPDGAGGTYQVQGAVSGLDDIVTDADVLLITVADDNSLVRVFARSASTLTYGGHTYVSQPSQTLLIVVGDIDDDTDVDRADVMLLLRDRNRPVAHSQCGADCDLDGDGVITVLDARQLALLCSLPRCTVH